MLLLQDWILEVILQDKNEQRKSPEMKGDSKLFFVQKYEGI